MTQPIVEVRDLSFAYTPTQPVLKNVSLSLPEGEFVGLMGANGGGKSTLIKILLGILPVRRGSVTLFGYPPYHKQARLAIGYVPQKVDATQNFPATVGDVILMGLYGRLGITRCLRKEHYGERDRIAELLGLSDLLPVAIGEISGGQFRRTLLARALIGKPRLLILDEPMAGIDSSGTVLFFQFLKNLRQHSRLTILMSSHDIDNLRAQADRLVCLNRIIHFCDSAHLVTDQLLHHTYECELETFYHNRNFHLLGAHDGCPENL